MWPVPVHLDVEWSVYMLVTQVSRAKMAEPVNMLFERQTRVDPHTHTTVLRLCGICPGKPG